MLKAIDVDQPSPGVVIPYHSMSPTVPATEHKAMRLNPDVLG